MSQTPTSTLDHRDVEERGLIVRYHRRDLAPEEEERFEAHFMDCSQCQEELELERSFARGMKALAAREAARRVVGAGLVTWLWRHRWTGALGLLVLVVGGSAFVGLLAENERLELRVAELAAGEGPTGSSPAGSQAELPVALLAIVRGPQEGPTPVTDSGVPYSVAVDVGADPRFESFAVAILDADSQVLFEGEDLQPNPLEVIQLLFPSGFLPAGEYRLIAYGTVAGGERVDIGSYPFRVTAGR